LVGSGGDGGGGGSGHLDTSGGLGGRCCLRQ
jgi:hypothetical protein